MRMDGLIEGENPVQCIEKPARLNSLPENIQCLTIKARCLNCCRSGALVAIDYGFMGPNYSISTACATANYAFVAAANHIKSGEADVMLAGGTEAPIIPVGLGGFVACRCPPNPPPSFPRLFCLIPCTSHTAV